MIVRQSAPIVNFLVIYRAILLNIINVLTFHSHKSFTIAYYTFIYLLLKTSTFWQYFYGVSSPAH